MRQERNTDQHGRMLYGSERNPNHWSVNNMASTERGVKIFYVSERKLSGASYCLELTGDEIEELHRKHIDRLRIAYLVENES